MKQNNIKTVLELLEASVDKKNIKKTLKESENNYRPLWQIASDIKRNWRPVHPFAQPYLEAMFSLDNINDNYMFESGRSVVQYFLSNANTWKGDVAKQIKAELKAMLAGKPVPQAQPVVAESKKKKITEGDAVHIALETWDTINHVSHLWHQSPSNMLKLVASSLLGPSITKVDDLGKVWNTIVSKNKTAAAKIVKAAKIINKAKTEEEAEQKIERELGIHIAEARKSKKKAIKEAIDYNTIEQYGIVKTATMKALGISDRDIEECKNIIIEIARTVGDQGTCVLGGGLKANGRLIVTAYSQGNIGPEKTYQAIKRFLQDNYPNIRCEIVWGNMD